MKRGLTRPSSPISTATPPTPWLRHRHYRGVEPVASHIHDATDDPPRAPTGRGWDLGPGMGGPPRDASVRAGKRVWLQPLPQLRVRGFSTGPLPQGGPGRVPRRSAVTSGRSHEPGERRSRCRRHAAASVPEIAAACMNPRLWRLQMRRCDLLPPVVSAFALLCVASSGFAATADQE